MNEIRDLNSAITVEHARTGILFNTNTTSLGLIIDLELCGGIEFIMTTYPYTDGTYTPAILVGNKSDLSDAVPADAKTIRGNLTAVTATGVTHFGLARTTYRYCRVTITSTGVTSGATCAVEAVKYDLAQIGEV